MNFPLTPGRVAYLLYYFPLGELRRSARQGGPRNQWIDWRGRAAMQRAAWNLAPPRFSNSEPPLEPHLLTGRAYAFQSLFCLWSLAHTARRNIAPVFHDDGTLSTSLAGKLLAVFPRGRIVGEADLQSRLESILPAGRFPVLRERFRHYPLLRKLGVHLGSSGWKLVLDSDLLFFRRPDFLLRWWENPRQPIHMVDVVAAYGYSRGLLDELVEGALPSRLNTGLCGLRSEALDWEKLERWCGHLLRAEGTHYFLEQTLAALLMAGPAVAVAPEADYITLPDRAEAERPRGVMHHYVHDAKRRYFRVAWRRALSAETSALLENP